MKTPSNVTIREAGHSDAPALRRLAALDSARIPAGRTLIAEHDGEPVAALAVTGGGAIADPFRFTAATVRMLELRARQLRAPVRTRRGARAAALSTFLHAGRRFGGGGASRSRA
jgi:hypothetical protein